MCGMLCQPLPGMVGCKAYTYLRYIIVAQRLLHSLPRVYCWQGVH
jgi:hypothetical protein